MLTFYSFVKLNSYIRLDDTKIWITIWKLQKHLDKDSVIFETVHILYRLHEYELNVNFAASPTTMTVQSLPEFIALFEKFLQRSNFTFAALVHKTRLWFFNNLLKIDWIAS